MNNSVFHSGCLILVIVGNLKDSGKMNESTLFTTETYWEEQQIILYMQYLL